MNADTDRVLVCPVCRQLNAVGAAWCAGCRTSLARAVPVNRQEAQESASQRRRAARRRRLLRYGLVGLVVAVLVIWVGYVNLDPFASLDPPTSTIGAVPGEREWAMFRRDPAHTGADVHGGAVPYGQVMWQFKSGEPIRTSPALVDGRVYLGTGDHRVVALEARTGEIVWEHETTGPVDWPVAVAGGMVFVALRDARVLALDVDTGGVRWGYRTSGPIHGSPAVDRGELFIGSDDFSIYALDAMTGEERWAYRTGGRVTSSPAANEDVVVATSEDKFLYVLDRATGRPRMDFRLTTGSGSPVLTDSYALAIDGLGRLTAIDWREDDKPFEKVVTWVGLHLFAWGILEDFPNQRGFVWSYQPEGDNLVGEPAVASGKVYVSGASGVLYALDLATGRPIWEFRAESPLERSPSAWSDYVYLADSGGILYAIDARTGTKLWDLDIGGPTTASPVIAGGELCVASEYGGLLAIFTPYSIGP